MKVWLLQRSEPTPHDNGGAQRPMRMGILAERLSQEGHQVLWWTSTFDHHNRRQRHDSDTRVAVNERYHIQYLRGCGYRRNMSLARLKENSFVARRFADLAFRELETPDVIVASVPTAELALEAVKYAKPRGIPVVLDIRDLWPDVFLDVVPGYMRTLVSLMTIPMKLRLERAFKGADAVIGLTDEFVDWGIARTSRTRTANDKVFPMGYIRKNLTVGKQDDGSCYWEGKGVNRNDYDLIVAFFGTLGKCFDLQPIVQAAQLLEQGPNKVKFVICGAGENAENLKVQSAGIRSLLFPGWVNEEQIRTLLELADVGLAPYIDSGNFINNLPNKPAEYLSGGAVIALSLDRGALFNLISKQNCGFSYKNDPTILAGALQDLSRDPKRLNALQSNAISTFQKYLDGTVIYGDMVHFLKSMAEEA